MGKADERWKSENENQTSNAILKKQEQKWAELSDEKWFFMGKHRSGQELAFMYQ